MLVRRGCVRVNPRRIVLSRSVKRQCWIVVFALWASGIGVARVDARPEAKISVFASGELKIRIKSLSPASEWSFVNAYAGVLGIAERVADFHAFGPAGEDLAARKVATGAFKSQPGAQSITYVVTAANWRGRLTRQLDFG